MKTLKHHSKLQLKVVMMTLALMMTATAQILAEEYNEQTELLIEAEETIENLLTITESQTTTISTMQDQHSKSLKSVETAIEEERIEWKAEIDQRDQQIDSLELWNKIYFATGCLLAGGVIGLSLAIAF